MRRQSIVAAAAIPTAVALLAGCSSAEPSGAEGDGGDVRVAFVSQIEGIPYFAGMHQGAQEQAEALGITYTAAGPATADATEQLRIFESLVQQGYDAIAISPLDPSSINSAIADARAAGVVVITSDADAPDSERQLFVSQASDEGLGSAAMDQIAEQMGGTGQYGIVSGTADSATFSNWVAAIQARQQEAYPDMELVGDVRYSTDTATALAEAQNLITAYPDLGGLIAVPSTAVPGVSQAVENAGRAGEIAVTGFGSPQTALPYVESGVMRSTVLWDVPALGRLTVWAMNELVQGREIAESNTIDGFDDPVVYDPATGILLLGDPTIFTAENINDFDY